MCSASRAGTRLIDLVLQGHILARSLSVSADTPVFDTDETRPSDDLKLQFEAAQRLDPDERNTLREVIEGLLLLKHEARR